MVGPLAGMVADKKIVVDRDVRNRMLALARLLMKRSQELQRNKPDTDVETGGVGSSQG